MSVALVLWLGQIVTRMNGDGNDSGRGSDGDDGDGSNIILP